MSRLTAALILLAFLILAWIPQVCASFCQNKDHKDFRVKLKNVKTLTFENGCLTTARRLPPRPQVKCVGGSAACSSFTVIPKVVICHNRGSDGRGIIWDCESECVDTKRYRLETSRVICEGYDYPGDPYVLRGSCGLEYTIDHVGPTTRVIDETECYDGGLDTLTCCLIGLGLIVICGVVAGIIRCCCCGQGQPRARSRPSNTCTTCTTSTSTTTTTPSRTTCGQRPRSNVTCGSGGKRKGG